MSSRSNALKKAQKKYYENHKEKIYAQQKAYRKRVKEELKELRRIKDGLE